MDASIKETIQASDKEIQYDEKAKKLLGHKIILAHILVNTVDEFRGMNPKEVVKYIEGEPYISVVPVDPGVTNTKENKKDSKSIKDTEVTEQIIGLNTENSEINEGMIRFDIIFYVRMKDGLTQMIINIEAQKEEPNKYKILNRAIFYICRMISSQKGRDFVNSEYNKLKRVYSIWICMNMEEDSLTHIHLNKNDIRKDVEEMCNLSQGIKEKAYEAGEKSGSIKIIFKMYEAGLPIEQIVDIIKEDIDTVKNLLAEKDNF